MRARVFREEESLFGRLERAHIEAIDRIVSLSNRYRGVSLSLSPSLRGRETVLQHLLESSFRRRPTKTRELLLLLSRERERERERERDYSLVESRATKKDKTKEEEEAPRG